MLRHGPKHRHRRLNDVSGPPSSRNPVWLRFLGMHSKQARAVSSDPLPLVPSLCTSCALRRRFCTVCRDKHVPLFFSVRRRTKRKRKKEKEKYSDNSYLQRSGLENSQPPRCCFWRHAAASSKSGCFFLCQLHQGLNPESELNSAGTYPRLQRQTWACLPGSAEFA